MKISEFAKLNNISAKALRHYEQIGLFMPQSVDTITGYREYNEEQSITLSWIQIFKELGFSLNEITYILDNFKKESVVQEMLKKKLIEISNDLNTSLTRRMMLER